jgi:hypothetical protein
LKFSQEIRILRFQKGCVDFVQVPCRTDRIRKSIFKKVFGKRSLSPTVTTAGKVASFRLRISLHERAIVSRANALVSMSDFSI